MIIDAVAADLNRLEQRLCLIHELKVGHYNCPMMSIRNERQILGAVRWPLALSLAIGLSACGQKGPLYLPPPEAPAPAAAPAAPKDASQGAGKSSPSK
jgi:predicted small lipoprotein YifL